MTTLQDILDPQIDHSFKGFPHTSSPLRRSQIAAQNWRVLDGDLPLPLALVKEQALQHNLSWMQRFAADHGLDMAPHGKTTMSPQLLKRQLDEGAWGLTFATVSQVRAGVSVGARRCMIANQVFAAVDLAGIQDMQRKYDGLRIAFLVDSVAQLALIEAWYLSPKVLQSPVRPFEVLLEIGVEGGRTGCRSQKDAMTLARHLHDSPACRLVGIECYEGLGATGQSAADEAYAAALMQRVCEIAVACDQQNFFDNEEVLVSAGGSAIFDLVANRLKPELSRPVRGILRSGCYVTHDHGFYKRMVNAVNSRLHCSGGLQAAMEVWASVQSCPEPGLVILAVGKRDISYDLDLPVPLTFCKPGGAAITDAPADWKISGLNDQHAYLRGTGPEHAALQVGDLVALGISHPCTTFDKWRWMPVVDENYVVCDALVTRF
ncbi:amino acid deaminase [Rhodoferax ferrireducens]|uniref:amino acid deaminase n=1 Tax=Rhodoferax ferrireducens TaxID=192843 RepID=UPI00298E80F2|nr:amino acid deaminase [Rhodoferax ferrireducens]WPC67901.1 amino acid deaminase [Rhodoferax ferrireducens]